MSLILRDPRDPPVAADGLCVVCGKERKPGQKREPHYSTAQADPFCSAECARAWYGVTMPSEARERARRAAATARREQVALTSTDDKIRNLARAGVPLNEIKARCHVGIGRVYSTLGLHDEAMV